ncbi:hypothetical protein LTR36_000826 [Oleoguttula mirabilis]|uniref:RING-type domain-containing protein n=1 Tax=Oleoguttula mirabilis TaxID=1507867 RepID=A0AAV9J4T9_9PEZI|nr:hypothetical protein LTR36_000826 [Oleoguttula mirabilis]
MATDDSMPTFTIDLDDPIPAPTIGPQSQREAQISRLAEHIARSMTRHQRALTGLTPYLIALTFTVLACALLQWPRKRWLPRLADVNTFLFCAALSWQQRPHLALLAANLAVGHVIWTSLPGSSLVVAEHLLPTHKEFMHSLVTTTSALVDGEEGEEEKMACMVCWCGENPLADLPCGHQACTGCLQSMGSHQRQIGCPLCRQPLFRGDERLAFHLRKGRVVSVAINAVLSSVTIAYRLRRGESWRAFISVLMLLLSVVSTWLGFPLKQLQGSGGNWWRGPDNSSTGALWRGPGFQFGAALVPVVLEWMTIWEFR